MGSSQHLGAKQHVCHVLDSEAANPVEPADESVLQQPQVQLVKARLPLQDTAVISVPRMVGSGGQHATPEAQANKKPDLQPADRTSRWYGGLLVEDGQS